MASDPRRIDRLDLDGYLGRLGISEREPGPEALAELHEAHVRTVGVADPAQVAATTSTS